MKEFNKVKKEFKKEMKKEAKKGDSCCSSGISSSCGGCSGCGYFLGFIGAATYYISTATGFWAGVVGFLKAIVWPAFLVFELLKMVGA